MSYLSNRTTTNPIFQESKFQAARSYSQNVMTIEGTINKTAISFVFLIISAYYSWTSPSNGLMAIGAILGFITAIVTIFKKEWSPYTVPAYAFFEGLTLGALSYFFEVKYPGIAGQAVFLTFAVLAAMLACYRLEWIRVTPKFKKIIIAATSGIFLLYFVNFIMGFFGSGLSIITSSSPMGIGLSLIIVGIAALNLVLDFDFIEKASKQNLPKYMEWYGAFGLLVTLIWLYIEILRLLAKLRNRK